MTDARNSDEWSPCGRVGILWHHDETGTGMSDWPRLVTYGRWCAAWLLIQVAQLWQRDRASSINDFRGGGVNLRLLWIEEYFSRHCDTTQFTLTHRTISSTRPSCWIQISTPSTVMREQHCGRPSDVYNMTGELSWQCLRDQPYTYRLILKKRKKSLFEPFFRALRGNVRTPSMARWKARGRLYIRRNWTFSAISYGWDVMSGNRSKSAFFEPGWVTLNADFRGKGASPTNHSWYQSSRVIPLSCDIKMSAVRHLVLSQSTRVTDRQTARITTPKTAFAYTRAVKMKLK